MKITREELYSDEELRLSKAKWRTGTIVRSYLRVHG